MTTTHKGVSIFYTDQGQGDALVLLHGFLESSAMWLPFIQELVQTHRVICIDLLGHGKTSCNGYIHTMEDMARAVHSVIEELLLDKITIIGHSMGGYVGCAYAKAYREKLEALCLLNSTPLPDDEERKLLRTRANTMAKESYHQLVRMSFTNLFDPETRKKCKTTIDLAIKDATQTPVQGYIAANSGMRLRENYSTLWQDGNFFKGMILGAKDWIIDSNLHQSQFENHTDYFKIIPGGHMSHIGQEAILKHNLFKFLPRKHC